MSTINDEMVIKRPYIRELCYCISLDSNVFLFELCLNFFNALSDVFDLKKINYCINL